MRIALLVVAVCLLLGSSAGADPHPYLDLDFEAPDCTSGWFDAGTPRAPYESGVDSSMAQSGLQALKIRHLTPSRWFPWMSGAMAEALPPSLVAGKRIRLSGYIKTASVTDGYAGLFWYAETPTGYAYADMSAGGVQGTTPWNRYEIELDIPADTQVVFFGTEMYGKGTAWFDNLRIEIDGHILKDGNDPHFFQPTPGHVEWLRTHAIPFNTTAAGNGFADLQLLEQTFGNARIVSLGEGTHGTREFFQMKHRLLEFLVEEMGFTHFAIEGSMPEAYRINEYVLTGVGDPEQLLAGMYFWTWDTQEILDMILWMRQYNAAGKGPVQFTGFDIQFGSGAVQNLRSFLASADPGYLPQAESVFTRMLTVEEWGFATAQDLAAAQGLFDYMSGKREDYLTAFSRTEVDWAIQNARILVQFTEWYMGINARDQRMAENAAWILDHAPAGSKIVLWAHNEHVKRKQGTMGQYLAERYGNDMYVVGFTFGEGSYNAIGWQGLRDYAALPPQPGSLETFLGAAGLPRFLLDLRHLDEDAPFQWFNKPKTMRSLGSIARRCAFRQSVAAQEYDGLIWIHQSTPSDFLFN